MIGIYGSWVGDVWVGDVSCAPAGALVFDAWSGPGVPLRYTPGYFLGALPGRLA